MGISIKEVRIRNYRSLKSVDVDLNTICLLIGQNNVGKTSFLSAINLALAGSRYVSSEDIYIDEGESLPKDRIAIIDLLIRPVNESNEIVDSFDDYWFEHFGDLKSEYPGTLEDFVAFRAIISLNKLKGEYEVERRALIEWPETEAVLTYNDYKKNRVSEKVFNSIPVFYMDAQRDIVDEMKDKKSYFGKMVSDIGLNDDEIKQIEDTLDDINSRIIDRSVVLKHLSKKLKKISNAVSTSEESIKINPVSRKIRDLNRGIDISFQDNNSESFPISNHGMGTRSWITFLTLTAYITWKIDVMNEEKEPYHPVVLIEEPESHLHPQAQRHILNQIDDLSGQKIISSHSPIIAGQVKIADIRQVSKQDGTSKIKKVNTEELSEEDIRKIKREVINTRGDLLFSNAMVLCEGETEEQVLPVFFKEYFGRECFEYGINIVGIGGSGKYLPFLRISKDLDIDYFIFSDGEERTIKKIEKDIKKVFSASIDITILENIVFLDDECDFEEYLIKDGYTEELLNIVGKAKGNKHLESYINDNHNQPKKPERTKEICPECKQNIFKSGVKDYLGDKGFNNALLDCLHNMKTEYSSSIAFEIIENRSENIIPSKIITLFESIEKKFEIKKRGEADENEFDAEAK